MKQQTYNILLNNNIESEILKILSQVRESNHYKDAKSVYVKLLFAAAPKDKAEIIVKLFSKNLPKAKISGMTLTLFAQRDIKEPEIRVTMMFFETANVDILHIENRPTCYMTAGNEMSAKLDKIPNKKAVEIIVTGGVDVDVSKFFNYATKGHEDIPFFGAVAGIFEVEKEKRSVFRQSSNIKNVELIRENTTQYVVAGDKVFVDGAVLAVFSGEELFVKCDYILGWTPIGKEFAITKMVGRTCVETIDDMPATRIYERYLGVHSDNKFLLNICEFPLLTERHGRLIARVPPCYDEKQRLYFNTDFKEGETFRLSYGHPQEILLETWEKSEEMRKFAPEAIEIVACGNRSLFLQNFAHVEIDDYKRFLPTAVASYGQAELYMHRKQGGVLNSALLILGLREGGEKKELKSSVDCDCPYERGGIVIPLATRLATFLDATAADLKEKAAEAERANVAKSQFLSNMSHEIRTPINAVLGMDEMILRECADEKILEYAENIRSASMNLLGLVNDILDFSKIEAGKLDIIPVEYEVSSVLNDLANMLEGRAKKKGLAFNVEVPEDIPSVLFGDEIRLKQVVTNILTNAVKYTEKGSVTLSITFKKEGDDALIRCAVRDTGIGIKEEDLNKLFNAFERIEESRNRNIEGTGLGLNITEKLLTLMDSQLKVESVYGEGSCFYFDIRQKIVNPEPMGKFEESYRHSLKKRETYKESFTAPNAKILVVDDTAMNLTVVKGLLKSTKIRIDTAESGFAALNMVSKEKYDIIFLDHRMPGIDGIETLKKMRETKNLNDDTPVISLTANAVSGARKIYIDAGFIDYLTKPIDSHQLENIIIKYLPKDKYEITQTETPAEKEDKSKSQVIPEWLFGVKGLDVAEGVNHCGNEELYLGALTVFAEAIAPGVKEIKHYFETNDIKSYTIKVHALKSTARVIGANELSERAKRLETAGNAGYIDEIKEYTPALLSLYESYGEKLKPLLENKEEEDKPEMSADELKDAFESLKEIAATFDYDSLMIMVDELNGYKLPEIERAKFAALKNAAKIPDWEKIREIL